MNHDPHYEPSINRAVSGYEAQESEEVCMINRTMTLEQAYRYVLRCVDRNTRLQQRLRFIKARKAEKFQFCAFNSEDSMWAFLSDHGNGIIVSVDGFYQYARV